MSEANNTQSAEAPNPETASTGDILATLRHDPFPGGEAPKAPEKKSEVQKTSEKVTEGKPAEGAPAQPAKTETQGDPEKEALKQSLSHASELLEAYKNKGKDEPGKTATPEGGKTTDPDAPNYNFNIPDQLVTALTSQDPVQFKQGLAGMASGIAIGTHNQVMKIVPKIVEAVLQEALPKFIQPALEEYNSRKSIFDDFYGTYKELNNPKLYPIVSQVSREVMTELKTDKWSPAIRDAVGKRVKEFLSSLAPAAPNASVPSHPVLAGGSGSRPSVPAVDAVEKDIVDTLFGT